MVRIAYYMIEAMKNRHRPEFLKACKAELDVTWDEFAALCELEPRAFKTYRMPAGSKNRRGMPKLVYEKVISVMVAHGHNQKAMEALGESLDSGHDTENEADGELAATEVPAQS